MISKRERTGVVMKWEMGWNVGLDEMREGWDGAWNGTGMELGKNRMGDELGVNMGHGIRGCGMGCEVR